MCWKYYWRKQTCGHLYEGTWQYCSLNPITREKCWLRDPPRTCYLFKEQTFSTAGVCDRSRCIDRYGKDYDAETEAINEAAKDYLATQQEWEDQMIDNKRAIDVVKHFLGLILEVWRRQDDMARRRREVESMDLYGAEDDEGPERGCEPPLEDDGGPLG